MNETGKKNKMQPLQRGNCICLLYINFLNKNEPMLTLGPDFKFTIAELVLFNSIIYFSTHWGELSTIY
jgi:hypothetical protein